MGDVKQILEYLLKDDTDKAAEAVSSFVANAFKDRLSEGIRDANPIEDRGRTGERETERGHNNPLGQKFNDQISSVESLGEWTRTFNNMITHLRGRAAALRQKKPNVEVPSDLDRILSVALKMGRSLEKLIYNDAFNLEDAVELLINNQTPDEIEQLRTIHLNYIGANKPTAKTLTNYYLKMMERGPYSNGYDLTEDDVEHMKDILGRYSEQLAFEVGKRSIQFNDKYTEFHDPDMAAKSEKKYQEFRGELADEISPEMKKAALKHGERSKRRKSKTHDYRQRFIEPQADGTFKVFKKTIKGKSARKVYSSTVYNSIDDAIESIKGNRLRPRLTPTDNEGNTFDPEGYDSINPQVKMKKDVPDGARRPDEFNYNRLAKKREGQIERKRKAREAQMAKLKQQLADLENEED